MQPRAVPTPIADEPVYQISDDELLELNAVSKWYRFERSADGSLIVTPPTGGETSARNAELTHKVATWNEHHGHGKVFDSSGGFVPPDSSMRAPDTSWVSGREFSLPRHKQPCAWSRSVPARSGPVRTGPAAT